MSPAQADGLLARPCRSPGSPGLLTAAERGPAAAGSLLATDRLCTTACNDDDRSRFTAMERVGLEPTTPGLQSRCSPS